MGIANKIFPLFIYKTPNFAQPTPTSMGVHLMIAGLRLTIYCIYLHIHRNGFELTFNAFLKFRLLSLSI